MNIDHYPFRFVKKDIEPWEGPQGFLMHRLLYSFKSPKSHQTYWVLADSGTYIHILINDPAGPTDTAAIDGVTT